MSLLRRKPESLPKASKPDALFFGLIGVPRDPANQPTTPVVAFSERLVSSGFLRAIRYDDLHHLMIILAVVSRRPGEPVSDKQLAQATNASAKQVHVNLERLAKREWAGEPLLTPVRQRGGISYAISSLLFEPVATPPAPQRHRLDHPVQLEASPVEPIPRLASATDVVNASRDAHGRARADVERTMASDMGWDYPFRSPNEIRRLAEATTTSAVPTLPGNDLESALAAVGLTKAQIKTLANAYPAERISRQLAWLPYRRARNKASFLFAAVRSDYTRPDELAMDQSKQPPAEPSGNKLPAPPATPKT